MDIRKTDAIVTYINDALARQEERIVVLTGRSEYARFAFELTGSDFIHSAPIDKGLYPWLETCSENSHLFRGIINIKIRRYRGDI